MGKAVRMADIAERLNISVVSVSKALAGKPGVSEEMRARVVALAKEMGYEGFRPADEMAESRNIGILVADRFFSENTFYSKMYRALMLDSVKSDLTCMLEIVPLEAEKSASLPALIVKRKVDGIIFMGDLEQKYLETVAESGLPCLLLDFRTPEGSWISILSNNIIGGYALTQHLLSTGRREIGFVGSILATSSIMDRYLGYLQGVLSAGITPRVEWRLEDRGEDGHLIPLQLPEMLPQAFVCNCDAVAYNLVDALEKRGIRVPEDVAVCGYDDFSSAPPSRVPLTSYRVGVEDMGRAAIDLMKRLLQGEQVTPMYHIVPGQLVVRESSGF